MVALSDSTCGVCDGTGLLLGTACPLCEDNESVDETSGDSSTEISSESDNEDSDEDAQLSFLPPAETRWTPGAHIRCIRFGKGGPRPARVTAVNDDGTYNVAYKDGQLESSVPNFHMQSPCLKSLTKQLAASTRSARSARGAKLRQAKSKCALAGRLQNKCAQGEDTWLVARSPIPGAGETLLLEGPILAMLRTFSKDMIGEHVELVGEN